MAKKQTLSLLKSQKRMLWSFSEKKSADNRRANTLVDGRHSLSSHANNPQKSTIVWEAIPELVHNTPTHHCQTIPTWESVRSHFVKKKKKNEEEEKKNSHEMHLQSKSANTIPLAGAVSRPANLLSLFFPENTYSPIQHQRILNWLHSSMTRHCPTLETAA